MKVTEYSKKKSFVQIKGKIFTKLNVINVSTAS